MDLRCPRLPANIVVENIAHSTTTYGAHQRRVHHRYTHRIKNVPVEIRTRDLRLRRPTLYPAELRAHESVHYKCYLTSTVQSDQRRYREAANAKSVEPQRNRPITAIKDLKFEGLRVAEPCLQEHPDCV